MYNKCKQQLVSSAQFNSWLLIHISVRWLEFAEDEWSVEENDLMCWSLVIRTNFAIKIQFPLQFIRIVVVPAKKKILKSYAFFYLFKSTAYSIHRLWHAVCVHSIYTVWFWLTISELIFKSYIAICYWLLNFYTNCKILYFHPAKFFAELFVVVVVGWFRLFIVLIERFADSFNQQHSFNKRTQFSPPRSHVIHDNKYDTCGIA